MYVYIFIYEMRALGKEVFWNLKSSSGSRSPGFTQPLSQTRQLTHRGLVSETETHSGHHCLISGSISVRMGMRVCYFHTLPCAA